MDMLERPAVVHQFGGQEVEEFGVRRVASR